MAISARSEGTKAIGRKRAIADELNEAGIATPRSARWARGGIRRVLRSLGLDAAARAKARGSEWLRTHARWNLAGDNRTDPITRPPKPGP